MHFVAADVVDPPSANRGADARTICGPKRPQVALWTDKSRTFVDLWVNNDLDETHCGPYPQAVGRPRTFDTSQALAAVRDRFLERGYAATSIDDLMTATGLGKGSLYGAFGDKRALFLRVLNEYATERVAAVREQLQAGPRAIEGLRSLLRPDFAPRGCFLVNCTYELAPHDVDVVALARKTFAAIESIFTDTVGRAVAEGDLPASTRPRELAATLLALMQGQECLARTGLSKAGLRGIAQNAAVELLGGEERSGSEKGRPRVVAPSTGRLSGGGETRDRHARVRDRHSSGGQPATQRSEKSR